MNSRPRCFAALVFLIGSIAPACWAKEDPVQWAVSSTQPGVLDLKATIEEGWHLYSPTTPAGGPIVTKIQLQSDSSIGAWQLFRPQPVRKLDPNFQVDTETYTKEADFLFHVTGSPSAATAAVTVQVRYQACSDVKCLPPVKKSIPGNVAVVASSTSWDPPAGYALVPALATTSGTPTAATALATPVRAASSANENLLPFLLTAFGAGLLALFTPCVFPMIPITVSFFLNQNSVGEDRRGGLRQAIIFCLGIIVLFTGMGFLVTAAAGPFGVVQLGSSPWVNAFISLVFFVFGLSLLGAFELRLPSGLLTRLDRASQGGGTVGTLIMGLTFSLTSFACIGPIVGPLLIASVQSKGWQPVLGMLAFATGLALPFFLLALFPSYLKKLPRSGGWMTRVKVVLGFVVLAVMLKYLSNIDQVLQTHWLTRERFLSAWIVLFALPGLYLLGLLRLEGIKKDESLGVTRALLAAVFLIFSISLVPGLFGARMGDLDALIPEADGSLFGTTAQAAESETVIKNDLEGALAKARSENKLVLVDFTGYACTNCHWMKQNMFTRPEIRAALKNVIVVELYTDGTDADSEKNQKLEDQRFNTASIPFYALMDSDQHVVATFPQLTRNATEFLAFLESKNTSRG